MKIKKLPYSTFSSFANKAGEATPPIDQDSTLNRNFMTITFEFFRVVGHNSYAESVPELERVVDKYLSEEENPFLGTHLFEWDSSSLGPYKNTSLLPSVNIKISTSEDEDDIDFCYVTFPSEGVESKLKDRYENILYQAEKFISALPDCALIATVKYQIDNEECSYPLCVLLEVDKNPVNQEIVKILI